LIAGEPGIPTQRLPLLGDLVGKTLEGAIRYSWLPGPEACSEYALAEGDVFELTAGPLLLTFSGGVTVGVSSQPSLDSIVVWDESRSDDPLALDAELSPIVACDPVYSRDAICQLVGQSVVSIRIHSRSDFDEPVREVPGEVAVELVFETGDRLFMGHGLHDGSDDFAVLDGSREHQRRTVQTQVVGQDS